MKKLEFRPLKTQRASEMIEKCISNLILAEKIRPGDKLPTERELSHQFDVSIVTVREALRGLEAHGFIKKRRGREGGTFIAEADSEYVKVALNYFFKRRNYSAQHLAEVRLALEPVTVRIAASQITTSELNIIENNISYCESKIANEAVLSPKDILDIKEKSIDFHRLIAQATHNPVFALTIDYVMDFHYHFHKSNLVSEFNFITEVVKNHSDIFSSLVESDVKAAETQMLSHIKYVENNLVVEKSEAMDNIANLY